MIQLCRSNSLPPNRPGRRWSFREDFPRSSGRSTLRLPLFSGPPLDELFDEAPVEIVAVTHALLSMPVDALQAGAVRAAVPGADDASNHAQPPPSPASCSGAGVHTTYAEDMADLGRMVLYLGPCRQSAAAMNVGYLSVNQPKWGANLPKGLA